MAQKLTKSDAIQVINRYLKEAGLRRRTQEGEPRIEPRVEINRDGTGKVIIDGWRAAKSRENSLEEIEYHVVEGIEAVAEAKGMNIEVVFM